MTRKDFVESLARDNQKFYGTSDGLGALRGLGLTFERRWLYVFELVQNALDADARSIAFRLADDRDALTFQHDGEKPINEKDVEGLSKIYRSTKGATSVGFMGIGFKSVFERFREARVSGWGWTFRYEMSQVVGDKFGDVQDDKLGAVLPIWDGAIAVPEAGFTTRFELRNRVDPAASLQFDLSRLLAGGDLTLLPILAASNLQRLDVNGRLWELNVDDGVDGSMTATARSADQERRWQLFSVEFEPSSAAIRRFLEHRQIQPTKEEREHVYAAAARPRRVLGVLPLDDKGVPMPPKRGRIYATLPTQATLPLGLHVNADWLLNISRTGLVGEIEDDPWQRDIVDRIADMLASVLRWAAHTFSDTDAVRAAFTVLALPSPDAGGLEAILAEERWLSRLRALLENASVLPVWVAKAGALGFAKPSDAIVPPKPLAEAFEEQPALRPAMLLEGPVLIHQVLGKGGRELLDRAGLLVDMSSSDLAQAWAGGLESWWGKLEGDESVRRDLLFRLWGAVAKLTADDACSATNLPCIRTEGGAWLSVDETVFLNGQLPSDSEPGGLETRQFMQPFIPEPECRLARDWISTLCQGASKERWERGYLSHAWEWLEKRSRSIGLRDLVKSAVNGLEASATPDWSVLVPLGRWAMYRNRSGLLIRVLVESASGGQGVPVGDALLAEPYVRGQNRKCLFPNTPPISAAYLDTETDDPHKWRKFFESAGAKGALAVRSIEGRADRWESKRVAEFLGLEDIDKSTSAYVLQDFDIEPALPDPDAPAEVRAAVAAWLDDGFGKLRAKGRRSVEYYYYSRRSCPGKSPSAWVAKLSELAWVPCGDNQLRRPRDVLPRRDPARKNAPFAKLSDDLTSVLEREGVEFGGAIPKATALQRLLMAEPSLAAEELAELLRDVCEQVDTNDDKRHFEQAVSELDVVSVDGAPIPFGRIAQRVGAGLRGALDGWIVPLDRFHEKLREALKHPAFPYRIPETTTGEQALAYLRCVWLRARSSPDGLANEVRNVLPTAYTYCLEDMNDNVLLAKRWDDAVPKAAVFDGQAWLFPAEADVYFDDIEDRRFFPRQLELRIVTGGHLGDSTEQRRRTARKLGLKPLSAVVEVHWREGDERPVDCAWVRRFKLVCQLLLAAKSSGRMAEGEGGAGVEPEVAWHLRGVGRLSLEVNLEGEPAEKVPVNARLHEEQLTVAGRPIQFAADAAKELLGALPFGHRTDLSADLTAMLTALGSEADFALATEKFKRSFAPEFELPATSVEEAAGTKGDPGAAADVDEPVAEGPSDAGVSTGITRDDTLDRPEGDEVDPAGGSFTRDRALALQERKAEELRSALKGEIALDGHSDDSGEAEERGRNAGGLRGDEVYRKVAAQYERESGRKPQYGDPNQEGWDLRSVDPETGAVRLIEVKGRGRSWSGSEVVELSRAQIHKAFEMSNEQTANSWHLYVVERTEDGSYEVLPIENPIHIAGRWILCGGPWRMIATNPRRITHDPER